MGCFQCGLKKYYIYININTHTLFIHLTTQARN